MINGLFWKYSRDGGFTPYSIPALEGASNNWTETMRQAGFSCWEDIGSESDGAYFAINIWQHEEHGFFLEVQFTFSFEIIDVICPDRPTLLCFLRDFAPLFQAVAIGKHVIPLLTTLEDTIFDAQDGVDPVVRVRDRERREKEYRDRMFPKVKA